MSEISKTEAIQNRGAKNQQAIVKATLPQNFRPRNYEVPGGITLRRELDTRQKLADAFHNWMRTEKFFTQFTFSFARNLDLSRLHKEKAETFPPATDGVPVWESHPDRRMFVAVKLSDIVGKYKNLVAIELTSQGIDVYLDPSSSLDERSEDWCPNYTVHPNKNSRGEYEIRY